MKTTTEHIEDALDDRAEEAQAEAEAWRRFAVVSLALNLILAGAAALGYLA